MKIGDILGEFKVAESAESIISLIENEELRNGVAAWKSVVVKYKKMTDCEEKEESAKWEWMWEQVEFDVKKFGTVAGVRGQDASSLFLRLKGLRLIYPDGTINSIASKYLSAMVMEKIKKLQPNK